jgi:hypothetical protein
MFSLLTTLYIYIYIHTIIIYLIETYIYIIKTSHILLTYKNPGCFLTLRQQKSW